MSKSVANPFLDIRSQKWDILKFGLIFFVVLGHAASFYIDSSEQMRSLFLFIYTFHMPLFIFISGLFSKKTINERRKEKLAGYLFLYIISKVILFFSRILVGNKPSFSLLSENGLPWFMFALFAFTLITSFIKDFSPKYILPMSIIVACFVGYDSQIRDYLVLSRIFVYFPFFYAGYCLDRDKLEKFCEGKLKKVLAFMVIVAVAVFVLLAGDKIYGICPLLTGRNPFSSLGDYAAYGFLLRLFYYVAVGILCCAIMVITPNKTPFGIIPKLGQRTLAVYLLHYPILSIMYNLLDFKSMFEKLIPSFSGYVIIPISVLITLVLSLKFFNNIVTLLFSVPLKNNKP